METIIRPGISENSHNYKWARFFFLRILGLVYFFAFLGIVFQFLPLVGSEGLFPADLFLSRVSEAYGSPWHGFLELPSLFWIAADDGLLLGLAWLGTGLSLLLLLGIANVPLLMGLWLLYLSFCHVGQIFYGYGWEMLLLESGFLAIFLCPLWKGFGLLRGTALSRVVVFLSRWLLFRLMFGAGLIKLRGDPCWLELTCLEFHFETQPLPNPLSPLFHHLPGWILKGGVLFNHLAELVAPWFLWGPKHLRRTAGVVIGLFQLSLILSGNLSFLNYLTLMLTVFCFDDALFAKVKFPPPAHAFPVSSRSGKWAVGIYAAVVAVLSFQPAMNMLNPQQAMNRSYDPLHLVNTYGAFGSITRERKELIIQGAAELPVTGSPREADWLSYEFPCKPGDLSRPPCLCSPYHRRLDWQMWFAAMSTPEREPWLIHLTYKLLQGDERVLSLFAANPFPDEPPQAVRILSYVYSFSGEPGRWWEKKDGEVYLPPVSLRHKNYRRYLAQFGWAKDL